MKAIFVGSIANGFGITAVIHDDAAAEDMVISYLANGTLAEAIDIQSPEVLDEGVELSKDGLNFIVLGAGIRNGFVVFGPFKDNDDAEEFGESERDEDEEWTLFTIESL